MSAVGLLDSAVEGSTVLQKHINTGSRCSLTASLQSLSDLLVTKCSAVRHLLIELLTELSNKP